MFYEQIGNEVTESRAILIIHINRVLLLERNGLLPQAMNQTVFVDSLQMSGS